MTSQGYKDWVKAGKPYHLIRPAQALQRNVSVYGITVYDYPDEKHLEAAVPEDHTPYSVTGYPGKNTRWNARALDIMPRSQSALHIKENADIGRQIIKDRRANHPGTAWIKYINWTDELGVCRQARFEPTYTTAPSSDAGHVHISGRSDFDTYAGAETYDPVKRMLGLDAPMTDFSNTDGNAWKQARRTESIHKNLPASVGDATASSEPNGLHVKLEEILAATGNVVPTDAQWTALVTAVEAKLENLFMTKGGQVAEAGAEAALRRVRFVLTEEV